MDLNVQKRFKREQADGKQRHDGGRQDVSSYAVLSDDTMRT
ncbi:MULTISPECIES: hypothetical protein [unclassified Paenibacillus]